MRSFLMSTAFLFLIGAAMAPQEALAKKEKFEREVVREYDNGDRVIVREEWVENGRRGPPPHAPAWGYRAKHKYRYYPDREVYYDPGRRIYIYREQDVWRSGPALPHLFGLDLGVSVFIESEREEPWAYEHEVIYKKYPPGQLKKMHRREHREDRDHGRHGHDWDD